MQLQHITILLKYTVCSVTTLLIQSNCQITTLSGVLLLISQQEGIIYDLATSQVKCYSSKLINRSGNNFLFDAQSLLSKGSQSSFSPPLLLCVLCLCHFCSPPGHLLPLYQLIHNYPVSLPAFFFSISPSFLFLLTFSYLSHPFSSPALSPAFLQRSANTFVINLLPN